MKSLFLMICLVGSFHFAKAQNDELETDSSGDDEYVLVIPPINEQLKLGVKMGTGAGIMLGNELQNPRLKYMISGGVYLHYRFSKHWSIQPETNVAFKGSNFKNGDGQYTSITMYTLDIPLLLMYGLTPQNTVNIFTGVQYSHILNKALYLKGAQVPESPSPNLRNEDIFVILGSQFQTPFVGFQVAAKYGLRDLNTGLLPNLNPPNTGKDIHQFVLELNLLF